MATLVEHPTSLPAPPDMSCHLRERSTGGLCQCMINGVLYNITIRHKTTGENVALLPGNQAMINRLAQGVFSQLMDTSQKAGVRNFNAQDVQKITVDLSDMHQPDAVTYESAKDKQGQALDSAQTFSLDARIVQTALPELSKVSDVAVSLRRVNKVSVGTSSRSEERAIGNQSIRGTLDRLRRGEMLTTDDMMNYTTHVIRRQHPDALFLEKRIGCAEFRPDGDGKAPIFETDNVREAQVQQALQADPDKPLVIFIHHHPSQHYSTIVAKNGQLFAYNPTGAPHTPALDLEAIYKGIYGRDAEAGNIHDYSVKPALVKVLHTIYETFKTGDEKQDAAMMQKVWKWLMMMDHDADADIFDVVEAALYVTMGEDAYGAVADAVTAAKDDHGVPPQTKIKNMIKAAAGSKAGAVDTHFANAQGISALSHHLTHQTDGVNCGPLALNFAQYMCSEPTGDEIDTAQDQFNAYISVPGAMFPLRTMRGRMADQLERNYQQFAREGQHDEFTGMAERVLSEERVRNILALPPFRSQARSRREGGGLKPEFARNRQVMHEISEMGKGNASRVRRRTVSPSDADEYDVIDLADSGGTPIMIPRTSTQASIPTDALQRVAQSAKVYYSPDKFPDLTRAATLGATLGAGALSPAHYQAARRKYIVSDNFLIFDEKGDFIPYDPRKVGKTVTAVAPNLRDPRDIALVESPATRLAHMKTLLKEQMIVFQKEGCKELVLPAFGCGAFSWPPAEVAQAYKEVMEENDFDFDAVHFALPHGEHYAAFKQVFSADYTGQVPVYLTEKDATGIIRVLSEAHVAWGELNPGNAEAQVGHNWEGDSCTYEPSRARNSAMIFGQRLELNAPQLSSQANWHEASLDEE